MAGWGGGDGGDDMDDTRMVADRVHIKLSINCIAVRQVKVANHREARFWVGTSKLH